MRKRHRKKGREGEKEGPDKEERGRKRGWIKKRRGKEGREKGKY